MNVFAGTGIPGLDDGSTTSDNTSLGLPDDTQGGAPPGFSTTSAAVSSPPPISTSQGWWNTIKQDSSSAVDWAESEVSSAASTVKSGASSLVSGAENAVTAPVKSIYTYAIFGIIVLVAGLYFIGKSGLVGQAAAVGRP